MTVRSYALWAPEMATPGGVQSYMWRLWEMLQVVCEMTPADLRGITLQDTTEALSNWPSTMARRPAGAGGSRPRFVQMALSPGGRARHVIVGHMNQAPVAWLAKSLGLIEDYVVILHGIEAWRRTSWLKRQAMTHARLNVATTRFTATICAEVNDLPAERLAVIPLCAEPRPHEPDEKFQLDGEWPLLFVGRLAKTESYKGLETVIEAVAGLQRENLPVKLHVIGDGDDRERLEAEAQRLMPSPDGITFHGRVDAPTLQAAYRSARTFVMPSAKEGFGIVFVEAMRHAVPCIGGAHGGTPEVFENGEEGILVQFRQTAQLQSQLRRLITCPDEANRLGEAGRSRFLRDYTFKAFTVRWMDTLAGLSSAPA